MVHKISSNDTDPAKKVYEQECSTIFLSFCSFVCIIKNKKMNMANIFLCMLKSAELRKAFRAVCDVDNDYEVLKCFLNYDPALHRSKYIRNFLAENPTLKL